MNFTIQRAITCQSTYQINKSFNNIKTSSMKCYNWFDIWRTFSGLNITLVFSKFILKPNAVHEAASRATLLHVYNSISLKINCYVLTLRPSPKMLFQGDTPEGSDTFQWPVIERDRVGGLRLMIWDKVKVPLCHYRDAPEESNLWTAWQLFPLDDD